MPTDPMSSRYVRLNKGGCISSSPCTAIQWVPSSRSLFTVAHADGTLIIYDREREDSNFVPRDPGLNPLSFASSLPNAPNGTVSNIADPSLDANMASSASGAPTGRSGSSISSQSPETYEWHPLEEILVTPGPSGPPQGGSAPSGKEKVLRNPLSHWRVSRKGINGKLLSSYCPSLW